MPIFKAGPFFSPRFQSFSQIEKKISRLPAILSSREIIVPKDFPAFFPKKYIFVISIG
jgi:hypothetical protein